MILEKLEQIKSNTVISKIPTNLVSMIRHEVIIGNKSVLAFMDTKGLYYLHSAQAANLVDKKGNAIESYIVQNALSSQSRDLTKECTFQQLTSIYRNGLERSVDWDPSVFVENGNNSPYRVIPIKVVVDFAWYHLDKGNKQARGLVYIFSQESLEIRCESVFIGISPNVDNIIENNNKILRDAARNFTKQIHSSFQQSCMLQHFPAAKVHDRITYLVTGQTAKMAIENSPCVGENPGIGLDHQALPEDLEMIGLIKVKFTGYKKGTWQERVDRAYSQLK